MKRKYLLIALMMLLISSCSLKKEFSAIKVPRVHKPSSNILVADLEDYILAYCWRLPDGNQSYSFPDDKEVVIVIQDISSNTTSIFNTHYATLSRDTIYKFGCVEQGDRLRYLGNMLSWRPHSDQLTFVSGIDPALTDFDFISVSNDLVIADISEPIDVENYFSFFGEPQGVFWSTDGEKFATLAFNTDLAQGGGPNIWAYDIETAQISKIGPRTRTGNTIVNATWSETDDKIAIGYGHPYSGIAITDFKNPQTYIEITSETTNELRDWPYSLGDLWPFIFSNQTVEFNYYVARNSRPIWLNGDNKILFVAANQNRTASLFTVNSDGTELKELLPGMPGIVALPQLSPDGRILAFVRYPNWKNRSRVEIATLNLETMEISSLCVLPAPKNGDELFISGMDWSPDGKYLAFSSNHEGESDIYLITRDGQAWLNLTENIDGDALSPSWKP